MATSLHNTWLDEYLICALLAPLPTVALPCGSRSISMTLRFIAAKDAARLMLVVVFPTPPFWLVIAIIFPTFFPLIYLAVMPAQAGIQCFWSILQYGVQF